jgi:signal transduction histidine kinase
MNNLLTEGTNDGNMKRIGLEEEKVFEQFYRMGKSPSLEYGGAGFRLAIVREIVRLHHGNVSIDSAPGIWMRIEIILPVERD